MRRQTICIAARPMHSLYCEDGEQINFVDWVDEPRHHLLFENEYTRIYFASFAPGEACSTLYHRHSEDTVYVCTSDGSAPRGERTSKHEDIDRILNQVVQPSGVQAPVPVRARKGLCFCFLHKAEHLIHRILTTPHNTSEVRFVGAEVLNRPPVYSSGPLQHPHYSLEHESAPFRAYRLHLEPGQETGVHKWMFSGVVFLLADLSMLEVFGTSPLSSPGADIGIGGAFWFVGPVRHSIKCARDATQPFEAVIAEWK